MAFIHMFNMFKGMVEKAIEIDRGNGERSAGRSKDSEKWCRLGSTESNERTNMRQQRASRRTKKQPQINVCAQKSCDLCGFWWDLFFSHRVPSSSTNDEGYEGGKRKERINLNHSLHSTVTRNNLATNEVIQHRRRGRPRHGHRQEWRSTLASPQGHGLLCKDHLQGCPRCSGCNNNRRVDSSEESECLYYGQKDLGVDPQKVPTPR